MLSVNLQKTFPVRFIQSVCTNISNSRAKKTALVASVALGLYFTIFSKNGLKANTEFYYLKLRAMFGKENDWFNYAQHCLLYQETHSEERYTYLKRAAEAGHLKAQLEFVDLFFGRKGEYYSFSKEEHEKFSEDFAYLERLIRLLVQSASLGRKYGKLLSAMIYKERAQINPEDSFENYKSARECFKELAENCEHNQARCEYAFLCYKGQGGDKDLIEARKYFQLSAEGNNYSAYYAYAKMCFYGHGGEKDLSEALKYVEKYYSESSSKSSVLLLSMILQKEGAHQDIKRARELLIKHKNDSPSCLYQYGLMYFNGKIVEQDLEKAFNSFLKARIQSGGNHPHLSYLVAKMINNGSATAQYQGDFAYALMHANEAAVGGVKGAQALVDEIKAKVPRENDATFSWTLNSLD